MIIPSNKFCQSKVKNLILCHREMDLNEMFGSFNPKSEAKTQPEKTNGKHSKTQSSLKRLPDNQGSKATLDQKSNKLKRLSEANEK